MNKKIFIVIAASLSCLMMFLACSHEYQGALIPVQDDNTGKWGYADTLGKPVIAFQWDTACIFTENLAVVGINGKYGYIDSKGTEVIPLKYDNVKSFADGLAEVELDGKIGSINTADSIVVAFQYKELQYLIGEWAMTGIDIETDKNNVFGFTGGLEFTEPGESNLLTFEKNDSCKSDINISDDNIFLNVKSLSFDKNDKWQFDNFVLGQSDGSKDSFIFSCNLKLLPQTEKFSYELRLQEKDRLNIQVSETVNRPQRSTEFGIAKGGTVRYKFKLEFRRLESLKK